MTYQSVDSLTQGSVQLLDNVGVDDIRAHATIDTDEHEALAVVLESKRSRLEALVDAAAALAGDGVTHEVDLHAGSGDIVDTYRQQI